MTQESPVSVPTPTVPPESDAGLEHVPGPVSGTAIQFNVLGEPGRDNALFVRLAAGHAQHRYLFDCGSGCLDKLPVAEIQKLDTLFLSHLHIDHISGFDHLLRFTFDRDTKPIVIYGPAATTNSRGTADIIHARLQGVQWDRVADSKGKYIVYEVSENSIKGFRFRSRDGFSDREELAKTSHDGTLLETSSHRIELVVLDHGSPSIGYILREHPKTNVDSTKLAALGLRGGAWLQAVKDPNVGDEEIVRVGETDHYVGDLRRNLLTETPGESIAYLTDFHLTEASRTVLAEKLNGIDTLVCENMYRDEDDALARTNFHSVSSEVAALAASANPGQLILFHLSPRYGQEGWGDLLGQVRTQFPRAYFPKEWEIDTK